MSSTYANRLIAWTDLSLAELLAHRPDAKFSYAERADFDLAEPLLFGSAGRSHSWRSNGPVWKVSVDFQRADRERRREQAVLQAELFGPILVNPAVDEAFLDHQDMWVVTHRKDGVVTITDYPEAVDHELTVAVRAWFDDNEVNYRVADLGRI